MWEEWAVLRDLWKEGRLSNGGKKGNVPENSGTNAFVWAWGHGLEHCTMEAARGSGNLMFESNVWFEYHVESLEPRK